MVKRNDIVTLHVIELDKMQDKHSDKTESRALPAWFDEVGSALAYAQHVVLSGNSGDLFPSPIAPHDEFKPLLETLWDVLRGAGFRALLVYDPLDGLTVAQTSGAAERKALEAAHFPLGNKQTGLSGLVTAQKNVLEFSEFRIALLVDHASHLQTKPEENLEDFFVAVDINSSRARQASNGPKINPTLWLVDHPADLPDWFARNKGTLREVQIEAPNLEDRFQFARYLARRHGWQEHETVASDTRWLQQFALECDGQTLVAMESIAEVAHAEGFGLERISDAMRVFRTGSRRNPWTSPVLQDRMRDARKKLEGRIKGQPHAIDKTLDILARSILGLSGVQSGAMHTRPRGALFFVGPTGVGKTELAKSVTELLFGDETLCHRFDMSEFMDERSISRLIGAPPGHPGHENGGELVNAAIRRPFSVFLFDEVEKAHPRVLDLFLQILDEGRLTDARGATCYFSEALIIFTSNIGMVQGSRATNMGMNVLPSDSHEELSLKITRAVEAHFRNELQRPELLNRIGQNIVAFDFLSPGGMKAIFVSLLDRVLQRVEYEHGVAITLKPEARRSLRELCTRDPFDGGRGIANRIETHFINPLARQFFLAGQKQDMCIEAIEDRDGKTYLLLEGARPERSTPQLGTVHPNHPSIMGTRRATKRPA